MTVNQFDNALHRAFFFGPGTTASSGNSYNVRWSEIVLAALRDAGVFDNLIAATVAPVDTSALWLDENSDPNTLRINDAGTWRQLTFDDLFSAGSTPLNFAVVRDRTFTTRTLAAATSIGATITEVEVRAFAVAGDDGNARYRRVDSEPPFSSGFRSVDRFLSDGTTDAANGGWWQIIPGRSLRARQYGLQDSPVLDQGELFQNFINFCVANVVEMHMDLLDINCGGSSGRIIFWNTGGTASGTSVAHGRMVGNRRRATRLNDCLLSVGNQNSITTLASTFVSMERIQILGAARFINVEGVLDLRECIFFPDTDIDYSAPPSDWAINSVSYPRFEHLLEFIECNHPILLDVTVSFAATVNNGVRDLSSALMANTGNMTWIGGRINNTVQGLAWDGNAVTGGSGARKAFIQGIHFEDIEATAVRVRGVSAAEIDCHIRMSNSWVPANGPAVLIEGATATQTTIRGYFRGQTNQTNGTAIRADNCDNLHIEAQFHDFETVLQTSTSAARGINFGLIHLVNVPIGSAYNISDASTFHVPRPFEAGPIHVVGANRNFDRWYDDFTGVALDASKHSLSQGSDTSGGATLGASRLQLQTGSSGASTHANNGIQVTGQLVWSPDRGEMQMEGLVGANTNAVRLFYGLTDTTTHVMPFEVNGTTVTANVTDGIGFCYDNRATDRLVYVVAVNNGIIQSLVTTATISSTQENQFTMVIGTNGDVNFWIDGTYVTTFAAASAPAVALAPYAGGYPSTAAQRELYVYQTALQQRFRLT